MKRRLAPELVSLFVEFFIAALAEALVAALGWVLRKIVKWFRKRKNKEVDDVAGD